MNLTAEYVRARLEYDPQTGAFTSVMRAVADRFQARPDIRSNRSRGASSREWQQARTFAEVVA